MKANWKRDIAIFLSSQTLSLLGSSLVQYAIVWHITLATKSGLWMTFTIIASFVPNFLLSPFAGVWADRYDRKRIIVLADALIALVTLAMALVFMAGHDALWLLLLAAAVRSFGSALQAPAVGAILPQIVPTESLMRVSGINQTIQSAIMLVSPMASGALMSLAPLEMIFFIDVVTAAIAISILVFLLKVKPHEKAMKKQELGYFADMKLGFLYIRKHRYLLSLFAYVGFLLLMVSPAAFLTPLQATRTFGDEVWRLTAIEILFSSGMMLGGLALSAWGGFRNRMRTMIASGIVMALCTLGLGLASVFWLYLAFMGVFGVSMPFYNGPSMVMLQEHVETEYMGRVLSVLTMLSTSLMPLGMLVFGPLADLIRIEWILLATGSAMLLHGILMLGNKRLIEAGAPREPAAASTGAEAVPEASAGAAVLQAAGVGEAEPCLSPVPGEC